MAERSNYYIISGISFDPIETDEKKIKDILSQRQKEWSKELINPIKRPKAQENLRILSEIEKLLLDPVARKKEADEAKKIRREQLIKMKEQIEIFEVKGYIKPQELITLTKKYQGFGISESEIRKSITKPVSVTKPITSGENNEFTLELTEEDTITNLEKCFNNLNNKYTNLYEFLGKKTISTPSDLIDATNTKKKDLDSRAEKTTKLAIESQIVGICLIVFADKKSKKKYDNYINTFKYQKFNEIIREGAVNNKKEISQDLIDTLSDRAVKQYNLSVKEVSAYIKKYAKYKGYIISGGAKIICGKCKTENPPNALICSNCAKALFIECPSCKIRNENSVQKCAKCGFEISKMEQALEYIINAKKLLAENKLQEAIKNINQAKLFWPNHLELIQLEKDIEEKQQEINKVIKSIMNEVNNKNYYNAKSKIIEAKNSGFNVGKQIIDKVELKIKDVENLLEEVKNISGEEGFKKIYQLSKEINDSLEIKFLLKKFPPEPVTEVQYKLIGTGVQISWKASISTGDIKYVVVRKRGYLPNNEKDGEIVYEGNELNFSDCKLIKCQQYYYAVFAKRVGIYSNASKLLKPIVILPTLKDVKVIGGDKIATISWAKISTIIDIKVWMKRSEDRPNSIDGCDSITTNRLDGITVLNLENGIKHWFIIQPFYNINGVIYEGELVYVNTIPKKQAKPLENFTVDSNGKYYTANWKQSEWDVILFVCKEKPNYINGNLYDIEELLNKYEKVDIKLKSLTEADFEMNFVGQYYIIPGVINGTDIILNSSLCISSMPEVEEVSYDTNVSGNELYLNFNWPKKFRKVAIAYRLDSFPEEPNDNLSTYFECTKEQYDYDAAIIISNPIKSMYYTKIYTVYEEGDEKVYSRGVEVSIDNQPQREVLYRWKYKKGIFGKANKLVLTINSNSKMTLPKFVLTGKFRGIPLSKDDGDLITSVQEETPILNNYSFIFEVDKLQVNTYIKMFFINNKHYKKYKLLNEGESKI